VLGWHVAACGMGRVQQAHVIRVLQVVKRLACDRPEIPSVGKHVGGDFGAPLSRKPELLGIERHRHEKLNDVGAGIGALKCRSELRR